MPFSLQIQVRHDQLAVELEKAEEHGWCTLAEQRALVDRGKEIALEIARRLGGEEISVTIAGHAPHEQDGSGQLGRLVIDVGQCTVIEPTEA